MNSLIEKTRHQDRHAPREIASLRHSEEMLRQLVENVNDVFWITTADASKLLYISPAYEGVWGRSCQSLYDAPLGWMESIHPDDLAAARQGFARVVIGGECCLEFRILRPDGSERWIRERAFPVRNEVGETVRIAGVAEDITDWKRLQTQLRTSEEYNRAISELTADYAYIARIDHNGIAVIETITEGFTRVTGYTLDELNRLGGWAVLLHQDDLPSAEAAYEKSQGDRDVFECRILTKSGEIRWIRYSWQRIRSTSPETTDRIVGAVQDITDRRLAEQRLRELSRRLLEVQEQERRHLARELHDEVAQHLTALNLNLDLAFNPNQVEARRGLEQARALLKEMAGRLRTLSHQLRPTMLDDLGLIPAAIWLFDSIAIRTRLHVHFEHHGMSRRLGPAIEAAAYRIIQEALNNVARHAEVDHVTVRAWLAAERLHLTIEDRGRGFDVDSALRRCSSAGLSGMQERAALLGGELTLESIPGRGTRVAAVIPISPEFKGEKS